MSAHKRTTVTIDESEYRRLHEAEMKLRFMQADLPEVADHLARQAQASLASYYQDLHSRQSDLVASLEQMHAGFLSFEDETNTLLLDQQAELSQDVEEISACLSHQVSQAIDGMSARFQDHLESLRHEREGALARLEQQLDLEVSNQGRKFDIAAEWLEAALIVKDFLERHYDHTGYAPGHLARYERRLHQARLNLENGLAEATLNLAQDVYMSLSELRLELEARQRQHTLLHQAACSLAHKLLARAARCRLVPAIDLHGEQLPFMVQVDFWVDGELQALIQQLEDHLADLEAHPDTLSIPDLRHLVQATLPGLEDQLDDLVYRARLNVINSQLRLNIADIVVTALHAQGYVLMDSSYEGDDMRASYYARVGNYAGAEILVQVNPVPGETGKNELHLVTSDQGYRTAHEMRQHSLEIRRVLQSTGLQVGALSAVAEAPGEAGYRSMPGVRVETDGLAIPQKKRRR